MTSWIMMTLNECFKLSRMRILSQSWRYGAILAMSLWLLFYFERPLFVQVMHALADVYLGVSIFIAFTLFIFYQLNRFDRFKLQKLSQLSPVKQIVLSAFLGALPGCGGAIIVVTQFVKGRLSFAALVTVLIATMGDAAFLLLAQQPLTALAIYGISGGVGILFGCLVLRCHGIDFLRPPALSEHTQATDCGQNRVHSWTKSFICLLIPGFFIGLLEAFQVDVGHYLLSIFGFDMRTILGVVGALMCILIWLQQPANSITTDATSCRSQGQALSAVAFETSFISIWVMVGFVTYELLFYFTAIDLGALFHYVGAWVIVLALIIGLIPGCGPQVVTTTLYLNGLIPFSALLTNAISNDGDALFPALALAMKPALMATLYSSIPALILGYSAYWFGY